MKRFKNILASVDSWSDTHPALEWAALIARHNQASVTLVDVQRELGWAEQFALRDYEFFKKSEIEAKRERLESLAQPIRDDKIEVMTKVLSGSTSIEIIREVLRAKHDLVVRVTKGTTSRRTNFFGSTTMRLFRKCPCPVWAVKRETEPRCQRILAAIDPAPDDTNNAQLNDAIMTMAKSLSEWSEGQRFVVYASTLLGDCNLSTRLREEFEKRADLTQQQVEEAYDRVLASHGLSVKSENVFLLHGDPEAVISRFAEEHQIDLIIMGTVARTGVPGLIMGNTAERMLNLIHCSVLTLKPDAFVSPFMVKE